MLSLIIAILLLSGCSDAPPQEIIGLRGFEVTRQPDDYTCGPACAQMVLRRYGLPAGWGDVESSVMVSARVGGARMGFSTPSGLRSGLQRLGVPCSVRRGTMSSLRSEVARGKPVPVLVRSAHDLWHWVVAVGFGDGTVRYADPSTGRVEESASAAFEGAWSFRTDLDGSPAASTCSWCGGSGRMLRVLPCDACLGSGTTDAVRTALRSAGIHSYTMVAPHSPPRGFGR